MYTQGVADAAGGPSKGSWAEGLDHWWNAVAGSLPEHRRFYEHLVEQGKVFMTLSQELMKFLTSIPAGAKEGDGWKEQLKSHFDAIKETLARARSQDVPNYLRGFSALFELPLDTWYRMMSGSAMTPGDVLRNVRSEALEKMGEQVHRSVDRFLSVPGVGYTRESQEQLQQFARALLNYQKVLQEYLSAHHHLGMDTLDRLYKKLEAMGEKGESIKTLRAMYDLWVDCGEESYAEFVMSPEFQDVYGEMVNALMAVKHQARLILDEHLGALNMPTRREMNSIIRHQNELRRSIKSLQRERNGRDGGPSHRHAHHAGGGHGGEGGAQSREADALRKRTGVAGAVAGDETSGGRPAESAELPARKKQAGKRMITARAPGAVEAGAATAGNSPAESQRPVKAGG